MRDGDIRVAARQQVQGNAATDGDDAHVAVLTQERFEQPAILDAGRRRQNGRCAMSVARCAGGQKDKQEPQRDGPVILRRTNLSTTFVVRNSWMCLVPGVGIEPTRALWA